MSAFYLKLIAMVTMVTDHIGYGFFPRVEVLRLIGRCAFIIYAFLMAESFYQLRGKKDRIKHHIIKLIILCFLSEIPYDIFTSKSIINMSSQSVMPTLLLGYLALVFAQMSQNVILKILIYFTCAYVSYFTLGNYKFAGVILIVLFYYYLRYENKLLPVFRIFVLIGILLIYWNLLMWGYSGFGGVYEFRKSYQEYLSWMAPNIVMALPLSLYNRKEGYRGKPFDLLYSLFYPVQFIILIAAGQL